MEDGEFWRLIDTLGGVAGDEAVTRLLDGLETESSRAFTARAHDLVTALLERCRVADGQDGGLPVQVGSAVVAAGRSTYDATLAAGGTLDPADWAWSEAAALLVADLGDAVELPPLALQWLTVDVPAGVTTDFAAALDDPEPSPARGPVGCEDTAWDAARQALLEDPGVARARQTIGERHDLGYEDVAVWLALRETAEPEIVLFAPTDELPAVTVVGTTPAADLRELDGEQRTAAYVELVTGLLQVVLETP